MLSVFDIRIDTSSIDTSHVPSPERENHIELALPTTDPIECSNIVLVVASLQCRTRYGV